ncbi:MAG: hypothetical protein ABI863_14015 [Ginsengibacter sp.]
MKQTKKLLLVTLSAASLLFSCNGNNNPATIKDSNPSALLPATENTPANSAGDASYSYKVDGKSYSGSGTNQIINSATLHAPGVIYFTLGPIVAGQLYPSYGFGFEVADKGTITVKDVENPDYSIGYTPPGSPPTVNYSCKEMTVTITSSGGPRVTGTFSGTMIEPKTDREVPVTDGKFDIPYSSLSKK